MDDTNARCSTCKHWRTMPDFYNGQGQCALDGIWMDFDEWCDDWNPDDEFERMEAEE